MQYLHDQHRQSLQQLQATHSSTDPDLVAFLASETACAAEMNRQLSSIDHTVTSGAKSTRYHYESKEHDYERGDHVLYISGQIKVDIRTQTWANDRWTETSRSQDVAAEFEFDVCHSSKISVVSKVRTLKPAYERHGIGKLLYNYIHTVQAAAGMQLSAIGGFEGATPRGGAFLTAKFQYETLHNSQHEHPDLKQRQDIREYGHRVTHFRRIA